MVPSSEQLAADLPLEMTLMTASVWPRSVPT
jgi:hypothetical protein